MFIKVLKLDSIIYSNQMQGQSNLYASSFIFIGIPHS